MFPLCLILWLFNFFEQLDTTLFVNIVFSFSKRIEIRKKPRSDLIKILTILFFSLEDHQPLSFPFTEVLLQEEHASRLNTAPLSPLPKILVSWPKSSLVATFSYLLHLYQEQSIFLLHPP